MKRLFVLWVLVLATAIRADELPTAAPGEFGLKADVLAKIRPAMQSYVDDGKLPGIVTIVARRGYVVHFEAVGLMDIASKKPMRRDAIFRIYSMTKPITSAALMTLYEEGRFELDDPVSKYIPAFKELKVVGSLKDKQAPPVEPVREMTIHDLLRHTAGLTYGFFGNTVVDQQYRKVGVLDRRSTLEAMVDKLSRIPLLYQPGTRWHYSVAVDVLGRLVEILSGQTLDVAFEQRILKPLDMHDTAFYVPEEKLDRLTTNYRPGVGGLVAIDKPATSQYRKQPGLLSGGGGMVSTARDYMRFCQMMLNGGMLDGQRILKQETVALMTQNHLADELMPIGFGPLKRKGVGFGLGFSVRVAATGDLPQGTVGEYGWGGAASTNFWISPREQLIGVAMTQRMPVSSQYSNEFHRLVYEAITTPYGSKKQPAAAGAR